MTSSSGLILPLLRDYRTPSNASSFETPPFPPRYRWGCTRRVVEIGKGAFNTFFGTAQSISATATTVVSIVIRVFDFHPAVNIISAAMTGIGMRLLIPVKDVPPAIRRIALAFLGQAIVAVMSNLQDPEADPYASTTSIAAFGVAFCDVVLHSLAKGYQRIESGNANDFSKVRFQGIFPNKKYYFPFKASLAAPLLYGSFYSEWEELRAVFGFFCFFYPLQMMAETIMLAIEQRIQRGRAMQTQGEEGITTRRKSRWLLLKNNLNTLVLPANIACFLGLGFGGVEVFRALGGISGFFSGIEQESYTIRYQTQPIEQLPEFHSFKWGETGSQHSRFRLGFPIFFGALVCGFTVWQVFWDLNPASNATQDEIDESYEEKLELLSGAAAFGIIYPILYAIDESWDWESQRRWRQPRPEGIFPDIQTRAEDFAIVWSMDPSILGIPLSYPFFVTILAMKLSSGSASAAIPWTVSALRKGAWVSYGGGLANDIFQKLRWKNGIEPGGVRMPIVDGAVTTKAVIAGDYA